ncbi:MAG: TetR/AcrR family transcriptional regulator [Myxococcales bacterium]|nr:TetR/AcrR family transcriptional regulator [Myxococcales bacterium]
MKPAEHKEKRDRGEEIREALVDALLERLAERSIASISVREIAAAASLNHGLVHRHFGSKEALVRAAIAQISDEIHRGAPLDAAISSWSFDYLRRKPALARIVARVCLDGPSDLLGAAAPSETRLAQILRPIERLLERFGSHEPRLPRIVNALATSAFLGWFVFRPFLKESFGIDEGDDELVRRLLTRVDSLMAAFGDEPR